MSWTSEEEKRKYEEMMSTVVTKTHIPKGRTCSVCKYGEVTNENKHVINFNCGHTENKDKGKEQQNKR